MQITERKTWLSDFRKNEEADRCSIVGKQSMADGILAVVKDMKDTLKLPLLPSAGNADDYMRLLIERIESTGVLVMRNSCVGTNHHRPLSVHDFRGFAIADAYSPVIFINTVDAPSARLFTLIHELAHIWLGVSGISDAEPTTSLPSEIFCNAVAAEFLVPEAMFVEAWKEDEPQWQDNLAGLVKRFHVSKIVIARRAQTLGFISLDEYQHFVDQSIREHQERERGTGGGNYWATHVQQVSPTFAKILAGEAMSGRILLRDAAHLLSVKPAKVAEFGYCISSMPSSLCHN